MNNYIIVQESYLEHNQELSIQGYKHAIVTILAASILLKQKMIISNVPNIKDVEIICDIFSELGGSYFHDITNKELIVDNSNLSEYVIPNKLSRKIHGSIYLIPAILGRFNKVIVEETGGCMIGDISKNGARPFHHMINVMEKFGATFKKENDKYIGTCQALKGCQIDILNYSDNNTELTGPHCSGATKTAILMGMASDGETIIKNPYLKADVTELLAVLKSYGYNVVYNDSEICIKKGAIIPQERKIELVSDVNEIITYICLALYMNISIVLRNVTIDRVKNTLMTELMYFEKMGLKLIFDNNRILIPANQKFKIVRNINVKCMGIYSDSHPFFTLINTMGRENSIISEYVWIHRFTYVEELRKLGILVENINNNVIIRPSKPIKGATLMANDLRAAAVLIIASLKCSNPVKIYGIEHLNRGYEDFIGTLLKLGAKIQNSQ